MSFSGSSKIKCCCCCKKKKKKKKKLNARVNARVETNLKTTINQIIPGWPLQGIIFKCVNIGGRIKIRKRDFEEDQFSFNYSCIIMAPTN